MSMGFDKGNCFELAGELILQKDLFIDMGHEVISRLI